MRIAMKFIRAILWQGATVSFSSRYSIVKDGGAGRVFGMPGICYTLYSVSIPMVLLFCILFAISLSGTRKCTIKHIRHSHHHLLRPFYGCTDKRCGSFIEFVFITFTIFYYGNVCIYLLVSSNRFGGRNLLFYIYKKKIMYETFK